MNISYYTRFLALTGSALCLFSCTEHEPNPSFSGIYTLQEVTYSGSGQPSGKSTTPDEIFPYQKKVPKTLEVRQGVLKDYKFKSENKVVSGRPSFKLKGRAERDNGDHIMAFNINSSLFKERNSKELSFIRGATGNHFIEEANAHLGDLLETPNFFDIKATRTVLISPDPSEIQQLYYSKCTFGSSHTCSGPYASELNKEEMKEEITQWNEADKIIKIIYNLKIVRKGALIKTGPLSYNEYVTTVVATYKMTEALDFGNLMGKTQEEAEANQEQVDKEGQLAYTPSDVSAAYKDFHNIVADDEDNFLSSERNLIGLPRYKEEVFIDLYSAYLDEEDLKAEQGNN